MAEIGRVLPGADIQIMLDGAERQWIIGMEDSLVRIEVRQAYDGGVEFEARLGKNDVLTLAAMLRGFAENAGDSFV